MKIAITTKGSYFRSMCLCVVERMTLDAVKVVKPGAPEEDVLDEKGSRAPGLIKRGRTGLSRFES